MWMNVCWKDVHTLKMCVIVCETIPYFSMVMILFIEDRFDKLTSWEDFLKDIGILMAVYL